MNETTKPKKKICKINLKTEKCSLRGTERPEECVWGGKRCKFKEQTKEPVSDKIRFKQLCSKGVRLGEADRHECLRLKEKIERDDEDDDENILYPTLSDPNFNMKIAHKKEFSDTKYADEILDVHEASDKLCQFKEFELSPHQRFVRNFLSFQTPYNSLLLFHGLGTGKTCSAILVCEEMRHFNKQMGISKKIIIVASPAVQENFKLQLFDTRKLKNIKGNWTMQSCTSNSFINEVNPMNMKGFTKEKIVRQVKRIIRDSYHFMGYSKFSNYIKKKTQHRRNKEKILKKIFSGRLIVIDEVHNIRITEDSKTKAIIENLKSVVSNADNLKLLLLSATPMFNTYKEIIWLLNLMNLNDNRFPIKTNEVFDKTGNFIQDGDGNEIGKELLIQKATGYISFVSGDNPYTFPYRISPKQFLAKKYLLGKKYPKTTVDGRKVCKTCVSTPIAHLDLVMNKIGTYQEKAYYYVIDKMRDKFPAFSDIEKGLGYQILEPPLQVLNMAYPSPDFDNNDDDDDNIILYGQEGLNRIMDKMGPKKQYKYKPQILKKYGRIFNKKNIKKYSAKIDFICKRIRNSKGIVLIYSQYIGGGCVPIALALEEMGFRRYGTVPSLFQKKPNPTEPLTFEFIPSYTMITGDVTLSPNNVESIKKVTDEDNTNGEKIKVVIISRAASEGIDLKNIRQIHILDPWYNLNRTEQILGRGIRQCSHKDLPFEERNVEIYMYGTKLTNKEEEAVDLYIYRLAEKKALKIGYVARVLKENAVDCILNAGQTGLTEDVMNQQITQITSSGKKIDDYSVGSRPYTSLCDYKAQCGYECNTLRDIEEINTTTYGEDYIIMNLDMITQIIRNLFKEKYYYKKIDLINRINYKKSYPEIQINMALNQLINDKNLYIRDMLDRIGYLINIDDLYMFQPIEIDNKYIMRYNREHPVDYKLNQLLVNVPKRTKSKESKIERRKKQDTWMKTLKLVDKQLSEITVISKGLKPTWYQLCYRAEVGKRGGNHRMVDDFRSKIQKYGIHHLIDCMTYDDKLRFLNALYSKVRKISVGTKRSFAKDYFDSFKIRGEKRLEGLILNDGRDIRIHVLDEGEWRRAKHTEFERFTDALTVRRDEIFTNLNNIIGYMDSHINKDCFTKNCFKILDITNKRDRGALCDNKSKKDVIYLLNHFITKNKPIGIKKYNENDEQIVGVKTVRINQPQLCCELELMMRYYSEERLNGKIWFLSLVDALICNIIK